MGHALFLGNGSGLRKAWGTIPVGLPLLTVSRRILQTNGGGIVYLLVSLWFRHS
jgi:hypothetical protein